MLRVRGLQLESLTGDEFGSISFEAKKGQVTVILGPNNSGKSRLLQTISDPQSNQEGTIIVNHYHAKEKIEKLKSQLGYVPQNLELPEYLTGFEYLELVGSFYHLLNPQRTERILALAQEFTLTRHLYTTLERVGRGAKQKTALIASLLASPSVLLWDEPFQGLDYSGYLAAKAALQTMARNGSSVVVATNDLGAAEEIGDYFIVLKHCEIFAEGTLTELAHQTQTTKSLTTIFQHLFIKK